MPIFRLEPIDPTDADWEGAAFAETVWTEAKDEAAARAQVTALTRPFTHEAYLRGRVRRWPWMFAARCEIDAERVDVSMGQMVTADGRTIGP
jgi:hypothetical protein